MGLNSAHEGYEYQDLLSSYYILKELILGGNCKFHIDKKENKNDNFDDLIVIKENKKKKIQIKYSNEDSNHTLTKADLSTDTKYNLGIHSLFEAWQELKQENLELRLALAWNIPVKNDKLYGFMVKKTDETLKSFHNVDTTIFQLNYDKIWPLGENPHSSWRTFNQKVREKNINREDFKLFCKNLIIEVELPKASFDMKRPSFLENETFLLLEKIGIGKYPNKMEKESALLLLLNMIKKKRTKSGNFKIDDIIFQLNIQINFGSIDQEFRINEEENIINENLYLNFLEKIKNENKIAIFGEPGAGKSWFIQNLIKQLELRKIAVIKHYCYISLEDERAVERINKNIFFGNLINDIIKKYPHLKEIKKTIYGSDLEELNYLLAQIPEKAFLIIDGLDHIERTFELKQRGSIAKNDTEIINEIFKLIIPDNITVLIASQPIEKKEFERNKFKISFLEKMDLSFILNLLKKNAINDVILRNGYKLSKIILDKSRGNALYIAYLIKEIRKKKILLDETIDQIPNYTDNLNVYYDYLKFKLKNTDKVINILCGISFFITKKEISEITGYSNRSIEETFEILEPVLNENYTNGGIQLYHESFRRYIIENIKKDGGDIKKIIFSDIIGWFRKKDFFSDEKSYRYFLEILFEAEIYDEILNFFNERFVSESLFNGYMHELIEKNYKIFLKTACQKEDFKMIIMLTEFRKILYIIEENFDENNELYFRALGELRGYQYLNHQLFYNGEHNFDVETGLKICYLCSLNRVKPQWQKYVDTYKNNHPDGIKIKDYHYFIRFWLDSNSEKIMEEIEGFPQSDDNIEFARILREEYIKYYDYSSYKNLFYKTNKKFWFENFDLEKNKYLMCKELNNKILKNRLISDQSLVFVKDWISSINYFFKNDNINFTLFLKEIQDINWYHNWLLFNVEIKKIENSNNILEEDIIRAYEILTRNLEPFLGEPRTCDLYGIKQLIYNTLKDPFKYIKTNSSLLNILEILKKISGETTVLGLGYKTGPLTADEFMQLMEEILTSKNSNIIIPFYTNFFNSIVNNTSTYYSSSAENNLRLTIIFSKAEKKEDAEVAFKRAITYLTGYGYRKDRTLSELIESIESINKIDSTIGNNAIKEIRSLSYSVITHTDGKSTKSYPVEWYGKFLNINEIDSIIYLRNVLLKTKINWLLEDSLIKLINKIIYKSDAIVLSFILKTFPINIEEEFLHSYMTIIQKLEKNDLNLYEISFNDFLNRFSFQENINYNKKIDDFINENRVKINLNNFKVEYKTEKNNNFHSKFYNEQRKEEFFKKLNSNIVVRKNFGEMNFTEITNYFLEHPVTRKDINGLIYYFEEATDLTDELKIFINVLASMNREWNNKDEHFKNIKEVFKFMNTIPAITSYANTMLFMEKIGDWYEKFIAIENFKVAYNKDSEIAKKTFFNNIFYQLGSQNVNIFEMSSNLIKSMIEVEYDKKEIIESWEVLFNIIKNRLPDSPEEKWELLLENELEQNSEELLVSILLVRLKLGTIESQRWILSGINYLLKTNTKVLIKPLKWFFMNKNHFLEISFVIILQLLWEFHKEKDSEYIKNFETELKYLYPTENFSINIMLENLFGLTPHVIKEEKIENYVQKNNQINRIVQNFINFSDKSEYTMDFFYENRPDIEKNIAQNFYENFCKIKEERQELYGNIFVRDWLKNITLPNINQNIINYYFEKYFKNYFMKEEIFYNINFDLKTMIAKQNSIITRPSNLKVPNLKNDFEREEVFLEEEWIRIGYYEEEVIYEKYKELPPKINKVFNGIVLEGWEEPFDIFETKDLWDYSIPYAIFNKILLLTHEQGDEIEDCRTIWISPDLIKSLELNILEPIHGLKACNCVNEVVLKYNRWDTNFLGTERFHDQIPTLIGCELLIRKDYYIKMCKQIGKPLKLLTRVIC